MKNFIVNVLVFIVGISVGFLVLIPDQNHQLESKLDQMSLNIKNIEDQLNGKNTFNKDLVKLLPYEDMSIRELLAELYNKGECDAK